jgi:Uncharacterised nucleotidyltransferase
MARLPAVLANTGRRAPARRRGDDARYLPLLALGSVAPLAPDGEVHLQLQRVPPQEAGALILRHKVRMQTLARLAEFPSEAADRLRAALAPYERVMRDRLRVVDSVIRSLDKAGRELAIAVYGIKGLVARESYAEPETRDIGDWDVYVDTAENAWRLAGWLRDRGFGYDESELPWFKRDWTGQYVYGQVRMCRPLNGVGMFIDIHYGGYSIRHCGLLLVSTADDAPGWHLLDRSHNLVLGIANAAGDQFIAVKDLNDLWLALHDPSVDWEVVRRGVRAAGLERFFNAMLYRLGEVNTLDARANTRVAELRCGRKTAALPPLRSPDQRQRWRATCRHAYAYGRRYSRRLAVLAALTAARYYGSRLHLRVVRQRFARLPDARPWRCVRLVPVGVAARLLPSQASDGTVPTPIAATATPLFDGALTVLRTPAGDLVSAVGDVFVPTVYYDLNHDLVAIASASAGTCTT